MNHTKHVKQFYMQKTLPDGKYIPWKRLSSEAKLFWIDMYNELQNSR